MIWVLLLIQGATLWWLRRLTLRLRSLPPPTDHSRDVREFTDSVNFLMAPGKMTVVKVPTTRQIVRPMGVQ